MTYIIKLIKGDHSFQPNAISKYSKWLEYALPVMYICRFGTKNYCIIVIIAKRHSYWNVPNCDQCCGMYYCTYMFQITHNILCFLLDAAIRSAAIMKTDRLRATANTEIMITAYINKRVMRVIKCSVIAMIVYAHSIEFCMNFCTAACVCN